MASYFNISDWRYGVFGDSGTLHGSLLSRSIANPSGWIDYRKTTDWKLIYAVDATATNIGSGDVSGNSSNHFLG
jgi:hypothetical protein